MTVGSRARFIRLVVSLAVVVMSAGIIGILVAALSITAIAGLLGVDVQW